MAGSEMAVTFSQYWKACTKVMPFMPPREDVGRDQAADADHPDPVGGAQDGPQGDAPPPLSWGRR